MVWGSTCVGVIKKMTNLVSFPQSEVPKGSMDDKPNSIKGRSHNQLLSASPNIRVFGLTNIEMKTIRIEGKQVRPNVLINVHKGITKGSNIDS
jgi:hypothetical protein